MACQLSGVFASRNDLHGSITDFREKPIQGRSFQQNLPTCAGGLTEHDVRKSFSFRKCGEAVSRSVRLHANDSRAKFFSQRDVPPQRIAMLRFDVVRRFTGRLDVDSEPTVTKAISQACTRTEDARGALR